MVPGGISPSMTSDETSSNGEIYAVEVAVNCVAKI